MRRPVRANRAKARVSQTRSAPAPVRGWNARDSIADMRPDEAIILDNWFPTAAHVELRKGSAEHVTGITGTVETLAAYRPSTGSQKLFGWSGTAAYDMSSAGAVGAAVLSSLTNARWQCVNFQTTGGHFLLCVNGADDMREYNGSAWVTINSGSTPSITNVNTNTLIGVHVHKERVWYIQNSTLDVWYTAAGAFAGALTKLPLGSVFKKGGYLMAMGTWTLDGGDGPDDLAVFITSEGEVAVYQGTDPASSSTWSKVGLYTVGTPIGRRCMEQLGSDLLIITTEGVIPVSRALIGKQSDKAVAITDRIQGAMAESVQLYGSTFGWECTFYPGGSALLLNVPVATGEQEQYVMNTTVPAKPWCRFTEWPASCFEVFNGELYFGTSEEVRKAWTGTSDVGAQINGEVLQAYNYFGNRNQSKHLKMVRPILGWDSNPAEIKIGVDVDFDDNPPTSQITLPQSTGAVWGTSLWGVGVWGGNITLNKDWYTVTGFGFAMALHLTVASAQAAVRYSSCDYVFEAGEIL